MSKIPVLGPVWNALLARLGLAASTAEAQAEAAEQHAENAATAAEQAAGSATTATTKAAQAGTSAGAAAASATAAQGLATTASGHAQTASDAATQAAQDAAAASTSAATATTKATEAGTSAGAAATSATAASTSAQNAATTVTTAAAQAVANAQAAVASLRAPSRTFYADAAWSASTDGFTFGQADQAAGAAVAYVYGYGGQARLVLGFDADGEPMTLNGTGYTIQTLRAQGVYVVSADGIGLNVDDQLLLGLIAGRDVDLNHAQILDLGVLRITLDLNP